MSKYFNRKRPHAASKDSLDLDASKNSSTRRYGHYQKPHRQYKQHYSSRPKYYSRHTYDRNYDRPNDRKYYSKTYKKLHFGYEEHEFRKPRRLSTFAQRKRNLKRLRKLAGDLAFKQTGGFVFKPGMISLLRPDTPRNTTQYISAQKPNYVNPRKRQEEKLVKESNSVICDKYEMTDYQPNIGQRTPDPKNMFPNLTSDHEDNVSHYSELDCIYDAISGTMEGLVNQEMFDTDPPQQGKVPELQVPVPMKIDENE